MASQSGSAICDSEQTPDDLPVLTSFVKHYFTTTMHSLVTASFMIRRVTGLALRLLLSSDENE